jgi:octaprenyl-diphosphate synthase
MFDAGTDRPFGLAASVEFIHTATLLHDDVVDGSDERRGQKAANLVFGNQASVLVGDFLFSRAFQLMTADGSLEVLRILSDASAIIAQGEVKQLTTANNLDTSMDDYIEVVSAKTAALFAAACEIGPVIAGQDKQAQAALAEYGMALGIAFQIIDDVLDYNAEQEKLGKAIGDDFREGKMTAPVLIALENARDDERAFWTRTMGELNQEDGDLARAMDIMIAHDSLNKGVKLAEDYAAKAIAALDSLPAAARDSELGMALKDLITFVINRAY